MKAFWIASLLVMTTACAADDTRRMGMYDLNKFIPDCSRKTEQMQWLKSQLPGHWEQARDELTINSLSGTIWTLIDGTYYERKNIADRRTQAVIRSYIGDLERYCPTTPKPAGCVTVRDSTQNGSSQGQRCYDGKRANPVVDRWQPMVDQ